MPSKKRKKQPRAASSKQKRPSPTSAQPERTSEDELDEAQLEQVSGGAGKVSLQDFHFTTTTTKSSTTL